MIEYQTPSMLLRIEATIRLDDEGLPYRVRGDKTLVFRAKPCRRAKVILTDCGFTRVC